MKLLVATNNPGKLREYQSILRALLPDIALLTLHDVGIAVEIDETGESFAANARLKAEGYAALSGLPTLADDSGLEVEALGGFPGVQSARWCGPSDRDRIEALLARMADVPAGQRGARFVCAAAYATPAGLQAEAWGEVVGCLTEAPRGAHGFGYDPIFLLPERGLTAAELVPQEKHALSHRGRAARAIAPLIAPLLAQADAPHSAREKPSAEG